MLKDLLDLHRAGCVKRFHTVPTNGSETIAQHSWGVALLILRLNPTPSYHLLSAAIYHDIPESIIGDVPATAKWRWPTLDKGLRSIEAQVEEYLKIEVFLTEEDQNWLKWCDMLDLCFYSFEQLQLGNRNMMEILQNGHGAICKMDAPEDIFNISYGLLQMAQEAGL